MLWLKSRLLSLKLIVVKKNLITKLGKAHTDLDSLMFMQISVTSNIKSILPKTDNVKEFMKFLEDCFQTNDKTLVGTLMNTLITMKFDGLCMNENMTKMTNIVTRLKSLGIVRDIIFS